MDINMKWYNIFGYLFLILTLLLQCLSLGVLCKCSRRLSGFRYRQLKLVFVCSIVQFAMRLVYEICYDSPLQEHNILCWTLRWIIEVSTCCTWVRINIIVGYYYAILKTKRDPDTAGKCSLCVCISVWSVPLVPALFYGITFGSPHFFDTDSCWRGTTCDILNIMDGVDKMFLLTSILSHLLFTYCHFYSKSPEVLAELSCYVPNMKGKTHLVALFLGVAVICFIPIETRAFIDHEHDLLVVTSWCVTGLMTALCFCFLDTEVQNAFFSKGNSGFNFPSEGSQVNLTEADAVANPLAVDFRQGSKRLPDYSGAGTLSLKSWNSEMEDIKEEYAEEGLANASSSRLQTVLEK